MLTGGSLEELMVNFNPSLYRKYVTTNLKGKPHFYVKMPNTLYGMLRSALLFYNYRVKDLEYYGYETNDYDPWV